MPSHLYTIFLDEQKIGTSLLEHADPSMGVLYGKVTFTFDTSIYGFLKEYCSEEQIPLAAHYPEERLIATMNIPNLRIFNQNDIEIKKTSAAFSGQDSDAFDIELLGVSVF